MSKWAIPIIMLSGGVIFLAVVISEGFESQQSRKTTCEDMGGIPIMGTNSISRSA